MKRVLFLFLIISSAISPFIGTEYVSSSLKRKTIDSSDIPETQATPITEMEDFEQENAIELESNPFGNQASLTSPETELSEIQINEIQMLLSLRDIIRVDGYLKNLNRQLNERIFGDLENTLLINKFTQSYQMYEMVIGILKKYKENKDILDTKAMYLQKIISYSLDYIEKADSTVMEIVVSDATEEANKTNKVIFMQILRKMKVEVDKYSEGIFKELAEMFKTIDETHKNPMKNDLEKIHTLIESCLALVVHKKTTLQASSENIMELRKLILANPKYHNYLMKIRNDKIVLGIGLVKSWLILLVGLVLFFDFKQI